MKKRRRKRKNEEKEGEKNKKLKGKKENFGKKGRRQRNDKKKRKKSTYVNKEHWESLLYHKWTYNTTNHLKQHQINLLMPFYILI